jgi:hypothetical protein
MLLAHLIGERGEEDEGEGIEDEDEGGDEDHRLARFLVGRRAVRGRRVRRAAVARGLGESAAA